MSARLPFNDEQSVIGRLISDVYNWLVPLAAINILWFLMSLTIILLPPATAGLFYVAYLVTRGEGPTVSEYFAGVRHWLWYSWLWGLIVVVFLGVAVLGLTFYSASNSPLGIILFAITTILTLLFVLIQAFFWPYMMLQEKPAVLVATRNAAFTLLADPLRIIASTSIMLVLLIISILLVFPFVVLTPVTVAFWLTYWLVDWLKRHDLLPTAEA